MDELRRHLVEEAVDHAFHNAPAAKAAWDGALAWFGEYLA